MPQIVADIADNQGDSLIFDSYTPGGYTLDNHSLDPVSLAKVTITNWDYVILQEQSQLPALDDYLSNGASNLCTLFRNSNVCGGEIYLDMIAPDGTVFPMHGNFQQLDEPEQLVLTTTAFHDENDNPGLKILSTIVFLPEDRGTQLTLQAVVMISTQKTEHALDCMEKAWNESLDKLERLVRNKFFNIISNQ